MKKLIQEDQKIKKMKQKKKKKNEREKKEKNVLDIEQKKKRVVLQQPRQRSNFFQADQSSHADLSRPSVASQS